MSETAILQHRFNRVILTDKNRVVCEYTQ